MNSIPAETFKHVVARLKGIMAPAASEQVAEEAAGGYGTASAVA